LPVEGTLAILLVANERGIIPSDPAAEHACAPLVLKEVLAEPVVVHGLTSTSVGIAS